MDCVAHQAPPSMGFSRQEYWSGLPLPSPMHERTSESEVTQSCPTLRDPKDYSLSGSFAHRIFQERVLEWVAIAFSTPSPGTCSSSCSFELEMPSNHLILFCPHLLLLLTFPSIWVFSNKSVLCIRWPKYWGFSISPCNEYSVLISFRID